MARKVAIIGANGTLGPYVLKALLSSTDLDVTVLNRATSTSTYPPTVKVTTIPDSPSNSDFTEALKSQDALVVTFAGSNSALQTQLADAAAKAGVRTFIPADFGSCDSSSQRALDTVPLYGEKKKVRDYLTELSTKSGLGWTSLVCGHFFDWGLSSGLLGFDIPNRKATLFDGGDIKWSATSVDIIGKAVVGVLLNEKETRNRMLYVESVRVSQNEVLEALKKATGEEWSVEHIKSEDYIKAQQAELENHPGDGEATENLVSVVGIIDSNWEGKKDLVNSLVGVEEEKLDDVAKKVVESLAIDKIGTENPE